MVSKFLIFTFILLSNSYANETDKSCSERFSELSKISNSIKLKYINYGRKLEINNNKWLKTVFINNELKELKRSIIEGEKDLAVRRSNFEDCCLSY